VILKKKKNRNKKNGFTLTRQLSDVEYRVVDTYLDVSDAANNAFDLFSIFAATTDYTDLFASFGALKWVSYEFKCTPFFHNSTLITDFAVGAHGVRQGVYDVGVTIKSISGVLQLPGSIGITNKTFWQGSVPINNSRFFPARDTNTADSLVPKVNVYFGYKVLATTNTNKSLYQMRLKLLCKCKIE
jgi:hypothetical protein